MISPFFCATTSTTETNTLSLHDALPISFQEFRRHAHGNIWRRRSEWQGRQSKVSGRFADEDGDCVFELGAGNSNVDGLCASRFKLSSGLLDLDLGSNASCKPALD